jgi:hypothetical protein
MIPMKMTIPQFMLTPPEVRLLPEEHTHKILPYAQ